MKCPYCGREFNESETTQACRGCAMFGGCRKVKCPQCGYESPAEPALLRWLLQRRRRRKPS